MVELFVSATLVIGVLSGLLGVIGLALATVFWFCIVHTEDKPKSIWDNQARTAKMFIFSFSSIVISITCFAIHLMLW